MLPGSLVIFGYGQAHTKLLVYLDQNFLSEMSKADINEKVRSEFKGIYELLHQGFLDEKLVVPGSVLHEIESSCYTSEGSESAHTSITLDRFAFIVPTRSRTSRALRRSIATWVTPMKNPSDPKKRFWITRIERVKQFGISIDAHLEHYNFEGRAAGMRNNWKRCVRRCCSEDHL